MHSTGGESRSSTPGSALDCRAMFSSHASPLPQQHTPSTSYPSTSSPSIMTASQAMYYGTKYFPSTPPEAHRFSAESIRNSSEQTEQDRYNDPNIQFRQLPPSESQNRSTHVDFQRGRMDETLSETYHRPVDDIYNSPVDLQRVPETNSHQLITAQRLVSELQRMQADGLRHTASSDSISPTDPSYRSSMSESNRSVESSYRAAPQESMLRTHSDPQRLVQESFKDFFPPPESPKPNLDLLRPSIDHRAPDTDRYLLTDPVRADSQRFSESLGSVQRNFNESEALRDSVSSSQEMLTTDDLRSGAETPQNGLH